MTFDETVRCLEGEVSSGVAFGKPYRVARFKIVWVDGAEDVDDPDRAAFFRYAKKLREAAQSDPFSEHYERP